MKVEPVNDHNASGHHTFDFKELTEKRAALYEVYHI
jgi:hypothetical protein